MCDESGCGGICSNSVCGSFNGVSQIAYRETQRRAWWIDPPQRNAHIELNKATAAFLLLKFSIWCTQLTLSNKTVYSDCWKLVLRVYCIKVLIFSQPYFISPAVGRASEGLSLCEPTNGETKRYYQTANKRSTLRSFYHSWNKFSV